MGVATEYGGMCGQGTWLGPCVGIATVHTIGGCRHEHVKERWLCDWHGDDLLGPNSHAYCAECDAHDGHLCRIIAKRLP